MEIRKAVINFLIIGIFILGAIILSVQLFITRGAIKEREAKECVGAVEIQNWEETIEITKAICIDAQNDQISEIEEIKHMYVNQIKTLEEEKKYCWTSYNWLKKQNNIDNN